MHIAYFIEEWMKYVFDWPIFRKNTRRRRKNFGVILFFKNLTVFSGFRCIHNENRLLQVKMKNWSYKIFQPIFRFRSRTPQIAIEYVYMILESLLYYFCLMVWQSIHFLLRYPLFLLICKGNFNNLLRKLSTFGKFDKVRLLGELKSEDFDQMKLCCLNFGALFT